MRKEFYYLRSIPLPAYTPRRMTPLYSVWKQMKSLRPYATTALNEELGIFGKAGRKYLILTSATTKNSISFSVFTEVFFLFTSF